MKTPFLPPLLLAAAALPTFWASTGHAQSQLLLNGTFATLPALAANSFSQAVGRSGSGATTVLAGTTGTGGWVTSEGDGLFEVWTPGYQGSPTGAGNTVELANGEADDTISQTVTSNLGGAAAATFSFGYAARDSGTDKFTATITDTTRNTTLFTQQFNPTASFATNNTFSQNVTLVPGDVYRVSFLDQNNNGVAGLVGSSVSAHIDNVSFVQAAGVPEPSPLAGVALGVAGLCLVQRLRRTA